jgi:putative copper resistance protein D
MVFLLSAGSLVSLVFVGHAAMDEGWLGDLHEANDAVHILAASGWIGCLIALVSYLDMLDDPELRHRACAALIRFSTVGHVAVTLMLPTGVVNTYLVLSLSTSPPSIRYSCSPGSPWRSAWSRLRS